MGIMKSYLIVALLLGMCLVLATTQDAAPQKWGREGLWDIDVDRDAGNVCFTTRLYLLSGVAVRIGVNPGQAGFHFMVGGKGFDSLEADRPYSLRLIFEDGKSYERDFEAKKTPRALILVNHVAGDDLIADLMSKSRLRIYDGNTLTATLSLDGASAALTQVKACQKEIAAAGSTR